MPLSDAQLLRQNPWWRQDAWERDDPHLSALRTQPRIFETNPLSQIDLRAPGVHIVRGPRQVGKSTNLKRLAARALGEGHARHQVIYLAADLLADLPPAELYATVARAKELAGATGPCLLMLDEVTFVTTWQNAVKALWDDGLIREDVVLCTGSSAIDLRRGAAERLPGRRRGGGDILVLPQSFGAVAHALDDAIPASPQLDVAGLVSPAGRQLLAGMRLHLPSMQVLLERYLRFGGLPAAVAELASGEPEPTSDTKRILHDALIKEITRYGASTTAAHALLERVVRSLGSKTNWADLGREMHVRLGPARRSGAGTTPDPGTVRHYVEILAEGFFLLILYFWRGGSHSNSLSHDKKMYFLDPLVHAVAIDNAPGLADSPSARVENLLATHLLRRYEPRDLLMENPAEPQHLHVWAKESGEIDFVAGSWEERAAVEVKYGKVDLRTGANVAKAHPGRPALVASKDTLILDRDHYVVAPAALVLWALGT